MCQGKIFKVLFEIGRTHLFFRSPYPWAIPLRMRWPLLSKERRGARRRLQAKRARKVAFWLPRDQRHPLLYEDLLAKERHLRGSARLLWLLPPWLQQPWAVLQPQPKAPGPEGTYSIQRLRPSCPWSLLSLIRPRPWLRPSPGPAGRKKSFWSPSTAVLSTLAVEPKPKTTIWFPCPLAMDKPWSFRPTILKSNLLFKISLETAWTSWIRSRSMLLFPAV